MDARVESARELTALRHIAMRRWPALLLAFCLVLSQQGALLHALSHVRTHAAAQGLDAQAHSEDATCVTCLAFAHLAGAMSSRIFELVPATLAHALNPSEQFASRDADVPIAQARAPPVSF